MAVYESNDKGRGEYGHPKQYQDNHLGLVQISIMNLLVTMRDLVVHFK